MRDDRVPASSPVRHIGHSPLGDVDLRSVTAVEVHHDDLDRRTAIFAHSFGARPARWRSAAHRETSRPKRPSRISGGVDREDQPGILAVDIDDPDAGLLAAAVVGIHHAAAVGREPGIERIPSSVIRRCSLASGRMSRAASRSWRRGVRRSKAIGRRRTNPGRRLRAELPLPPGPCRRC